VRFEVFHNGTRVARAGILGYAVLNVGLTWVRRDVGRFPPGTNARAEDLGLIVGGLDSNDPGWSRHVRWATPRLGIGDRIEILVSDDQQVDAPTSEKRYRNRKRPEPPPRGDPCRSSVKDAIVWSAPRGVYLEAMDRSNGGPVALSGREARRLAGALERLAAGPHRRRRR